MAGLSHYPLELRNRAVRMVAEVRPDHPVGLVLFRSASVRTERTRFRGRAADLAHDLDPFGLRLARPVEVDQRPDVVNSNVVPFGQALAGVVGLSSR
ncbi:hypothetical protein GCM10010411_79480 [Actinomadura fulvescens]|uniref:Uncharacterized protein n=1 Tax=Actinomadura fulvescens TaxID=46160 RepID=A0ABP6D1B9_9ACTN